MRILGIIVGMTVSLASIAQVNPVENWCGTSHRMNDLMQNPAYQLIHQQDELIRANEAANPGVQPKGTIYAP